MSHTQTPIMERYEALGTALCGGPAWWASSPVPDAVPRLGSGPQREPGPGTAVLVATSGSTGVPRYAQFTAQAVLASATAALQWLGGPGQWVVALPTSHAAGVQVLARSWVAGLAPVDGGAGSAPELVGACEKLLPGQRHYVSLVPTQLARLLSSGPAAVSALASFDAVLVGGAGLAPDVAAAAAAAQVRVVTTYGATETCGGCVYDGAALPGYEVRIERDSAAPAGQAGQAGSGRIALRGPSLMSGYLGDEQATAQVLRDGWFHTPDVGRWEAGRLEVLGRADDVINTGGLKVHPGPVAGAVADLTGASEAVVLPVADAEWGQAAVAVLELPPATVTDAAWFARVRDGVGNLLGRASAPQALVVLDTLPRLALGKVDRQAIVALLAGLTRERGAVRGVIDRRGREAGTHTTTHAPH